MSQVKYVDSPYWINRVRGEWRWLKALFQTNCMIIFANIVNKTKCHNIHGPDGLLIKGDHSEYIPQLSYSRETLKQLPDDLPLRQILVVVDQPGLRIKESAGELNTKVVSFTFAQAI